MPSIAVRFRLQLMKLWEAINKSQSLTLWEAAATSSQFWNLEAAVNLQLLFGDTNGSALCCFSLGLYRDGLISPSCGFCCFFFCLFIYFLMLYKPITICCNTALEFHGKGLRETSARFSRFPCCPSKRRTASRNSRSMTELPLSQLEALRYSGRALENRVGGKKTQRYKNFTAYLRDFTGKNFSERPFLTCQRPSI